MGTSQSRRDQGWVGLLEDRIFDTAYLRRHIRRGITSKVALYATRSDRKREDRTWGGEGVQALEGYYLNWVTKDGCYQWGVILYYNRHLFWHRTASRNSSSVPTKMMSFSVQRNGDDGEKREMMVKKEG